MAPTLVNAPSLIDDPALLVVVLAPNETIAKWIDAELAPCAMVQTARTMRGVVKALVEDPAPRPHVLIVDLDAIAPVDLIELHSVRHLGWFGSIIALGKVPTALRDSLSINHVMSPPFVQYQLHDAIIEMRTPAPTVRIPIIRDAQR